MPAIAIVIESVEASVRSELDAKAWNISPTRVEVAVDEPGLELGGKVMSAYRQSAIELIFRFTRHFDKIQYSRMIFPFALRAPRK